MVLVASCVQVANGYGSSIGGIIWSGNGFEMQ